MIERDISCLIEVVEKVDFSFVFFFLKREYNTLRANDSLEDEEFWILEDEDIGKAV